jgi:hypothetical protein
MGFAAFQRGQRGVGQRGGVGCGGSFAQGWTDCFDHGAHGIGSELTTEARDGQGAGGRA